MGKEFLIAVPWIVRHHQRLKREERAQSDNDNPLWWNKHGFQFGLLPLDSGVAHEVKVEALTGRLGGLLLFLDVRSCLGSGRKCRSRTYVKEWEGVQAQHFFDHD